MAALTLLAAATLLRHLFHLTAELLDLLERLLHRLIVLLLLGVLRAGRELLLDLLQLIAQIVQTGGDLRLGEHGVLAHAAADPVGVALHPARKLLLLHLAQGVT